jgi:hypothetical protein
MVTKLSHGKCCRIMVCAFPVLAIHIVGENKYLLFHLTIRVTSIVLITTFMLSVTTSLLTHVTHVRYFYAMCVVNYVAELVLHMLSSLLQSNYKMLVKMHHVATKF